MMGNLKKQFTENNPMIVNTLLTDVNIAIQWVVA